MIEYYTYKKKVDRIDKPSKECWVNVIPPFSPEEFKILSEELGIPADFLADTMDVDERSRYEIDGNVKMIVVRSPCVNKKGYKGETNEPFYITAPISIIWIQNVVITIDYSAYLSDSESALNFVKSSSFSSPIKMLMHIFEQTSRLYMKSLKEMDSEANLFEARLYTSNKNQELLNLLKVQKSMVYFVTSLRANEMLFMKLSRQNFLKLNDEDVDYLTDIIVDTSQAVEMANTYTNILSNTLDAYASIIANNQNEVLKKLSIITLVVTIPTLVASIFGMNVPLPLNDSPASFYMLVFVSFLGSFLIGWIMLRRNVL